MRVLGRIRLSKLTENSSSIERQRQLIQNWADANDHTVVAWAEDIDVSGALSPFKTKSFGPYLTKPLCDEWDIVCAWKLDRFARRSIELHRLFAWVQDNDKQLVCVSDNIDLSNWVGRLVASVIAGVAEGELEAIRLRAKQTHSHNRKLGRWASGAPPYGYRIIDAPAGQPNLEINEDEKKVVLRIRDMLFAGKTFTDIMDVFNEEQVPYRGSTVPWDIHRVSYITNNQALLGWVIVNGDPLLDEEGNIITQADPILTYDEYQRIQRIIAPRQRSKGVKQKPNPLHNVLKCGECGGNMSKRTQQTKFGPVNHCVCKSCKGPVFRLDEIIKAVHVEFEERLGNYKIRRIKPKQSTDSLKAQLDEARAAYQEVSTFLTSAPGGEARQAVFQQLTTIGKRIENLEHQIGDDTVEWVEENRTYLDKWNELDEDGKRHFLLDLGLEVHVFVAGRGPRRMVIPRLELRLPALLQELLDK